MTARLIANSNQGLVPTRSGFPLRPIEVNDGTGCSNHVERSSSTVCAVLPTSGCSPNHGKAGFELVYDSWVGRTPDFSRKGEAFEFEAVIDSENW